MRITNSYAAAVAAAVSAVVFSAAFQPAEASFIFYAEQVGADVVITGTGSFITSGSGALPLADSVPGITPSISTGTTNLRSGPVGATQDLNFYGGIFTVSQPNLSTVGSTLNASSGSGTYIGFNTTSLLFGDIGFVSLSSSLGSGVPFGNTSTYSSTTLAAFGWTAGTYATPVVNRTYTMINGETIQILGVPEPTHMVLVAGVGAALGAWRLRKLRRSREAAGDAIAG